MTNQQEESDVSMGESDVTMYGSDVNMNDDESGGNKGGNYGHKEESRLTLEKSDLNSKQNDAKKTQSEVNGINSKENTNDNDVMKDEVCLHTDESDVGIDENDANAVMKCASDEGEVDVSTSIDVSTEDENLESITEMDQNIAEDVPVFVFVGGFRESGFPAERSVRHAVTAFPISSLGVIAGSYRLPSVPAAAYSGHSFATCVCQNQLYFCGGNDAGNSFARYRPMTSDWQILPSMPCPRRKHSAVAVGSNIYVIGGEDLDEAVLDTILCFSVVSLTWSLLYCRLSPAVSGIVSAVLGNNIYIFGGHDCRQEVTTTVQCVDVIGERVEVVQQLACPELITVACSQPGDVYVGDSGDGCVFRMIRDEPNSGIFPSHPSVISFENKGSVEDARMLEYFAVLKNQLITFSHSQPSPAGKFRNLLRGLTQRNVHLSSLPAQCQLQVLSIPVSKVQPPGRQDAISGHLCQEDDIAVLKVLPVTSLLIDDEEDSTDREIPFSSQSRQEDDIALLMRLSMTPLLSVDEDDSTTYCERPNQPSYVSSGYGSSVATWNLSPDDEELVMLQRVIMDSLQDYSEARDVLERASHRGPPELQQEEEKCLQLVIRQSQCVASPSRKWVPESKLDTSEICSTGSSHVTLASQAEEFKMKSDIIRAISLSLIEAEELEDKWIIEAMTLNIQENYAKDLERMAHGHLAEQDYFETDIYDGYNDQPEEEFDDDDVDPEGKEA